MIHLIEDEANIRKLLLVNLSKRGHEVVESATGQQGLQHLAEQRPELILLNITLPDLSGFEILEHLDRIYPPSGTPAVILITATAIDEKDILDRHPRIVKIFTKPFDINELISFVHSIMDEA